jgi:hypothetical protein
MSTETSEDSSDLTALVAELQAEVADLRDHQRIREVYIRYGRGIDRLDEQLYRSSFWPDAQINYGTRESITPDEHWGVHMIKNHKGSLTVWSHLLTNQAVDIDGDVAHVEIYMVSMPVPKENKEKGLLIAGRYIDRVDRRGDEWRIAVREFIPHFAMKVDSSNYDRVFGSMLGDEIVDRLREPKRDTSYVRPLNRRTKEAGPPVAE